MLLLLYILIYMYMALGFNIEYGFYFLFGIWYIEFFTFITEWISKKKALKLNTMIFSDWKRVWPPKCKIQKSKDCNLIYATFPNNYASVKINSTESYLNSELEKKEIEVKAHLNDLHRIFLINNLYKKSDECERIERWEY